MATPPCLAYLLDTPDEPGAVVTYRCTRPAGHTPTDQHEDHDAGRTWTAADDVVWATGSIYPVREDRYPWTDGTTSTTPGLPPLPTTPASTGPATGPHPWSGLRADAIGLVDTTEHPIPSEENR